MTDGETSTPLPEPARQNDVAWLQNTYRGDAPQLTFRAIVCGFCIGGLMVVINLYIGAKVGFCVGMSITAVVVSYLLFHLLAAIGAGRPLTILENNIVQSIASSAGYMSSPLIASLPAFMMVSAVRISPWEAVAWMIALAGLGISFAIPLKRRFINDIPHPFPEGQACGVLLNALHADESSASDSSAAMNPSPETNAPSRTTTRQTTIRSLFTAMLITWPISLLQFEPLLRRIGLGRLAIPNFLDQWYYDLAKKYELWVPKLANVDWRSLSIRPSLDVALFAIGGIIGLRTCGALLFGAIINYFLLVPWMIGRGDIPSSVGSAGALSVKFSDITAWSLWCGVAIMTTGSIAALFLQFTRSTIRELLAFRKRSQDRKTDPLAKIEIPTQMFWLGTVIFGSAVVVLANIVFKVPVVLALAALPLIYALTFVAVTATADTSFTPHGPLAKLTQLFHGTLTYGTGPSMGGNIATAGISAEVAFQSSNLIQNMKPGYMIGAVSGSIFGVVAFYSLLLPNDPTKLLDHAEKFPFPSVVVWKSVAELVTTGIAAVPRSALIAALVGAVLAVALEAVRRVRPNLGVSTIGLGLAFVLPFYMSLALFVGAFAFAIIGRASKSNKRPWLTTITNNREAICAGALTAASLAGILGLAFE